MKAVLQFVVLCVSLLLMALVATRWLAIVLALVLFAIWVRGLKTQRAMKPSWRDVLAAILLGGILLGFGCFGFMISQPWCSANTISDKRVDPNRLQEHVKMLSETYHPRSYQQLANLNLCADHIFQHFKQAGAEETVVQEFTVVGKTYKNVRAFFGPKDQARLVVGAHYDSCDKTPGADDNASGVAGLIELAYLLGRFPVTSSVELVAYSLEEPPFFGTELMGSAVHAESLAQEKVSVKLMICLEMIGYFTEEQGSQSFPSPLMKLLYPKRGNFIAIAGRMDQGKAIKQAKSLMKGCSDLPVYSIAAPVRVPGIDFSDHRNYWPYGYAAIMVTDTALYRNKAYHTLEDTADRLDYQRMADVVVGVYEICAGTP